MTTDHQQQLIDDLDPKYTDICSQRTVQSNERGFFQELFDSVCGTLPPKWLDTAFAKQSDNLGRMRCLLDGTSQENRSGPGRTLMDMLEHVQPVFKPKDARFSLQRRRDGERLCEEGKWNEALAMLSLAVMRAPAMSADLQSDGGLQLALALWSRSGVLLELNNGPAALGDLQCALASGLPAKQHGAYYLRLAKANAMSGDTAKAHICIALVERLCSDMETRRGLQNLRENIDKILHVPKAVVDVPSPTDRPHPHLAGASSLLDIRNDTTAPASSANPTAASVGHYAYARQPIRTADILLVEQPLIACLLADCHGTHCLHCMRSLRPPAIVPYGCDNCAAVAFCSVECKQTACRTYHKYECKFGDLLIGSGMSVLCYMALRAVTQWADGGGGVSAALENGRRIVGDMCAHSELRQPLDLLRRAVMAGFLLSILQKAGVFGAVKRTAPSASAITSVELEVAAMLLGLLEVLQFNAHEIYETRLGAKHRVLGSKPAYIGVALYRTAAYFNHDCHPAVSRYFVGTSIVLAATRPLQAGDSIGENYGPVFTKRTRSHRQRELRSRYWFRCACRCCAEDWPLLEKLDDRPRLKCPTTNCSALHAFPEDSGKAVNCKKCRKLVTLLESVQIVRECEDNYRRAAQLMDEEKLQDAVGVFASGIDLFYTVAVPPHKDTQLAQESLRTCLADRGTTVAQLTNKSLSAINK